MKLSSFTAALAASLFLAALVTPAEARSYRHHHHNANAHVGDPRPHAWCGWWLRHYLGVGDRAGNLARWWARYGSNAHSPSVGAIAVWPHHVGILTGHSVSGGWILKSGNDRHAVRERERSLRGVIAFRWPNGIASR